jgi:hypothetical protein
MEMHAPLRAFVQKSSEQVQPIKARLVRIGRSRALRLPKWMSLLKVLTTAFGQQ